MYDRFKASCAIVLIVFLLVPFATADIPKEQLGAIVAARSAEKEAFLAECPYIKLRNDLFARYVRDPEAVAGEGDVVVDASWIIVQSKQDDPVAVKMGAMLAQFMQEVMGLKLSVVESASTDASCGGLIDLLTQGGGQEGVPESFTVTVAPKNITVAGIDTPGLRDGVVRLIDLFGFRMAPFLQPQDITYTPRIPMRRSASVPGHDKTVLLGSNAVGVGGGELYSFSTSNAIPGVGGPARAGTIGVLGEGCESCNG